MNRAVVRGTRVSAGPIICSRSIHGLTGCCVEAQEDRKRTISSKFEHDGQRYE
jgi:hypothetical protein